MPSLLWTAPPPGTSLGGISFDMSLGFLTTRVTTPALKTLPLHPPLVAPSRHPRSRVRMLVQAPALSLNRERVIQATRTDSSLALINRVQVVAARARRMLHPLATRNVPLPVDMSLSFPTTRVRIPALRMLPLPPPLAALSSHPRALVRMLVPAATLFLKVIRASRTVRILALINLVQAGAAHARRMPHPLATRNAQRIAHATRIDKEPVT